MKKILIVLLIISIQSCKQKDTPEYAIISANIHNSSTEKLSVYNAYTHDLVKEVTLTNGQFLDTLYLKNNIYYVVEDKNVVYFFVEKGDKLQMDYDSEELDATLTFKGNNVAVNNYLLKKSEADGEKLSRRKLFSKNEGDFVTYITAKKQRQKEFLLNFGDLPEEFLKKQQSDFEYEFQKSLSNYESDHGYYTKKENYVISDTIKSVLKALDYNKLDDYIFSSHYRGLVRSYYNDQAKALAKKDTTLSNGIARLKVYSNIPVEEIKNNMAYYDADVRIRIKKDIDDYYALYSKVSTDEAYNKKIDEAYKKIKSLSKGSPSPKFVNYENNAGGTTSLDDLKGKYVFIDIWATWCTPCIAEIPSLKKIEKKYHGKNIAFVGISVDDKKQHEKWKKMIVDKGLVGIQLFADNSFESKFIEDYMIIGIPRFILIDPEGNIVSANAPRPSDDELVALFDELNL